MDENTYPQLLPCPHCGGKAKITLFYASYTVACMECPACVFLGPYQTKEEAIKAWNRRVRDEQKEV